MDINSGHNFNGLVPNNLREMSIEEVLKVNAFGPYTDAVVQWTELIKERGENNIKEVLEEQINELSQSLRRLL